MLVPPVLPGWKKIILSLWNIILLRY
jgi:hypothetical protein